MNAAASALGYDKDIVAKLACLYDAKSLLLEKVGGNTEHHRIQQIDAVIKEYEGKL